MSQPVIILGAGASYDYIHEDNIAASVPRVFQPPMSNNLFDRKFEKIIQKYPEVMDLSADISAVLRNGKSLENHLSFLQEKINSKDKTDMNFRRKQLLSFSFYLQDLFREITNNFGKQSSNNYAALKNYILDYCSEACIVNFNYDLLFEQALGYTLKEIDNYIKNPIKIIKVHGAFDWMKVLPLAFPHDINEDYGNSYNFLMNQPWYIDNSKVDMEKAQSLIYNSYEYSGGGRSIHLVPYIAIPTTNKNSFVCPNKHIEILQKALQDTDRILIIGWKAEDQNILELIKNNISKPVKLVIVSGSEKGAEKIASKFSDISNIQKVELITSFSSFVGSTICEDFFSN